MPSPRVFISSTCYDLKYIRENLKFFIRNLGYEPILSEEGAVFYDPNLNTQDACLAEVPACQMFVLIIGGRYGSRYKKSDKSITNAEFQEAVKTKIPLFALVDRSVYDQYRVYLSNKDNPLVDHKKISYPAVDSTKIFDFVEEVQSQAINNALVPFSDFEEMQSYLKQQWAGMLYRFLTSESEAKRVGDILSTLSGATEKIEFLTRQIVDSVGNPTTKIIVEFYDFLLGNEVIRDLATWNLHPSPKGILQHETLDDFCGQKIEITTSSDDSLIYGGPPYRLSQMRYNRNSKKYKEIRGEMIKRLEQKKISLEKFLKEP
jgi:hypothetical protein